MSEKEKMLQGKIYDSMEEPLYRRRLLMSEACIKYNNLPEDHPDRAKLLKEIFPHSDESLFVRGPVFVDYGENTYFGKNIYFNFNLVILDVCPVHIGNNVVIGAGSVVVKDGPDNWLLQGILQRLLNNNDLSMFVDTIVYNFEDSLSRIDKMMGVVMTEQKPSVEIPYLDDLPEDRGGCYSTVMAIRLKAEKSPTAERMKETRAFLSEAYAILASHDHCVDIITLGNYMTAVFSTPLKVNETGTRPGGSLKKDCAQSCHHD